MLSLMYRCNTIDLRIVDIYAFNKTIKSFLYADMIESPDELTLHRNVEDGGLGLLHIQTRARAALLSTFLQTAIRKKFTRNHYHNYLYQYYVLGESVPRPEIPPNFTGDFFPTIRKLRDSGLDMEDCSLKQVYGYLTQSTILTLNLEVEPSLELPFTWLVGTLLASIWKQREARRVNLVDTRAELEAKCRLLRECKVKVWTNAYVTTSNLVSQLFTD